MKHEIINRIIKDVEATSYCEIGYGNGDNFKHIKCDIKTSVDPNTGAAYLGTSDDFFNDNEKDFDVVFIDGLHHCDQVRKDIINAMKCNANAIILHDTIPQDILMQIVPRAQKVWTGDCWRAAVGFIQSYPDVLVETYRADWGLTVIYPQGKKVRKHFENTEMTYKDFKANEVELLRIID